MDGALVVFVKGLLALRLTGGLAQGLNFATDLLRGTGFAFHGTDYTKSTLHMPLRRELRPLAQHHGRPSASFKQGRRSI